MKIDAHQHFWQYDPAAYPWINEAIPQLKQDYLPDHLGPLLRARGFSGCIAVQARQSEQETEFLLELASQYPFILGVVGWVDIQQAALESRLLHYQQFPLLRGFRHIVQDEPDGFLLQPAFVDGVRMLQHYGFSYDLLVYERQLPDVLAFLDQCPDQSFVLDHLGKPQIATGITDHWRAHIRAVAAFPNVYCKLSGMVTEADWAHWKPADFIPFLEEALYAFGPQRLMIGSDWPVCLLASTGFAQTTQLVETFIASLPLTDQASILGGNAMRFYQLDPRRISKHTEH